MKLPGTGEFIFQISIFENSFLLGTIPIKGVIQFAVLNLVSKQEDFEKSLY